MKLRTLLILCPPLLAATLAFAATASASEVFPAPSGDWESVKLLDAGTGRELGRLVPSQWDSVVEMEVKTGRVLQRTECNDWQDARTPDACEGEAAGPVPLLPANLAGLLGLI